MRYMSSRKIDDFEAFKIYLGMRNHFSKEYDYTKYKGGSRVKMESYQNRKDKRTFEELSRRYDKKSLEEFLLSVFLNVTESGNLAVSRNEFMWTKNLLDKETQDIYKNWKKRLHSIKYLFTNDSEKLFMMGTERGIEFNDLFRSIEGDYPLIVQMEKNGEICFETLVIFNMIFNFVDNVRIDDTTYWPIYIKKVKDYSSFLTVDIEYYVGVIKTLLIEDYYENYGKFI
jgi:hypothetical protein|tara:strand:- start:61 stop:744 length:684 start_codon:yes stop_codon:yes gene_type:complete